MGKLGQVFLIVFCKNTAKFRGVFLRPTYSIGIV